MKTMKAMKATTAKSMKAMKSGKKKAVSKLAAISSSKVKKGKVGGKGAHKLRLSPEEQELVANRMTELNAMSKAALRELLSSLGLKAGIKRDMVDKLLAHEAKMREEARARKARAQDVLAEKKKELEARSGEELRQLCADKGLKLGYTKQERVERLLANFEEEGGVELILGEQDLERRREDLCFMDTADLLQMCHSAGIDPFVKEVLVERIIRHEMFGKGNNSMMHVLMNE
jgi:hypothetical protein